ncbi:MAG: hypothetical protein IMW89_21555 [Ktedonobacteraceae bacterium]|nr:hypothetical protein [Ktedonobacteraceae bacterium]
MLDIFISGLINGNTYVLIAVGMSLIFGVANLVNFAHGSIFALGAMLGWWFAAVLHWPLWGVLLAVIIATAALGALIEYSCIRPLWPVRGYRGPPFSGYAAPGKQSAQWYFACLSPLEYQS